MSSRNLASTHLVSAVMVSAATPTCDHGVSLVHKACNGITKQLIAESKYVCPRCKGNSWPINGWTDWIECQRHHFDVEATLCYLDDMQCTSGGCDSAVAARCCVAWGKFRKSWPDLTTDISPRICGKRCKACVCSARLYCRES